MKDQYNVEIPSDLVSMPDIKTLTFHEIKLIEKARWYDLELQGGWGPVLAVSAKEIKHISEDIIMPIDIDNAQYVDRKLHRYSFEDGFYHA